MCWEMLNGNFIVVFTCGSVEPSLANVAALQIMLMFVKLLCTFRS